MLTADQQIAKLADFGVARVNRWDGDITQVGSECYAAPEHFTRAGATVRLTPAADVYALAKTAYFLMCGVAPRAFAQRQITAWPDGFEVRQQGTAVLQVIRRATAMSPRARQQTVEEFWVELENAAQSLPVAQLPAEKAGPAEEDETHIAASRSRVVIDATRKSAAARKSATVKSKAVAQVRHTPVPPHDYRSAVVVLLFLLIGAGVLRTASAFWQESQKQKTRSAVVTPQGRTGVMTTDVNIRLNDSASHTPIGLAERASRVRVLAAQGEWYLIEVIQHARPKKSPDSADQGWVRSRFVILND